jgi:hypothetical protein
MRSETRRCTLTATTRKRKKPELVAVIEGDIKGLRMFRADKVLYCPNARFNGQRGQLFFVPQSDLSECPVTIAEEKEKPK